jgi:hypothetical protein
MAHDNTRHTPGSVARRPSKMSVSHWQLGCPHAARHEVARMLFATGKYDRSTADRLAREAETRANRAAILKATGCGK